MGADSALGERGKAVAHSEVYEPLPVEKARVWAKASFWERSTLAGCNDATRHRRSALPQSAALGLLL